jgi:cob(I)alamin adenosyltransferase
MVVLNKIYTKTGDKGTTALGTGERVPKTSLRIAAYGTVDETNSHVGVARVQLAGQEPDVDAMLLRVQNDLFDLGADLCVPDRGEKLPYEPLRVADAQVKRLEDEIDMMNASLQPLRSFILPGGTLAAATLHVARTVSRRAERAIVELSMVEGEQVSAPVLKYINRLSDFLFVASRYLNDRGKGDILWVPGKNR